MDTLPDLDEAEMSRSIRTGEIIEKIVDIMSNMDPSTFPGSLDTQKVGWGDENDPLPALPSEDYLVPRPDTLPEVYEPNKWVPPEPRRDQSTPLTIFNEIVQKLEGRITVTWTDEKRDGKFFYKLDLSMGPYRGSYCTPEGWAQKRLAQQNTALLFLRNPAPWVITFVRDGEIPEGCEEVFSPEFDEKIRRERVLNAAPATLLAQKKKVKGPIDFDKQVEVFEFPEFSVDGFTKAVEAGENVSDLFDDGKLVVHEITPGNSYWPITATIVTIDFAIRRWSDNKLVDCGKNDSFLLDYGGMLEFFHPVVSNMQVESEVLVRASNEYVLKGQNHTQLSSSDAVLAYIKLVAAQPYKMSKEEKQFILNEPLVDRHIKALEAKRRGNQFLKRGLEKLALDQYMNSVRLLTKDHTTVPKSWAQLTALLHWKCAWAFLHLGNFVEAEKSVSLALATSPKDYKYLLTRALIAIENHDYLEALVDLRAINNITDVKKPKYLLLINDLARDLEPHKALLDQAPEKPEPVVKVVQAPVVAPVNKEVKPVETVTEDPKVEAPKEVSKATPVAAVPVDLPAGGEAKLKFFLGDTPVPPVPEEPAKLEIYNLIKNFIMSDNATLEFEATTDAVVRSYIHQSASDFGITSTSTGPKKGARKTVCTKVAKKGKGATGAPAVAPATGDVQHVQMKAIETVTAGTTTPAVKAVVTQQATTENPATSYQTWLDIPIDQRSNTRLIWTRPAKSDLPIRRVVIEDDSESEEGDGYQFNGYAYMGNFSTLMNVKPKEGGENGPESEEDDGVPNDAGYESDPEDGEGPAEETDKKYDTVN